MGTTVQVPHDFHSWPKSLKEMIHAMNPPLIEQWVQSYEHVFENRRWSEECQGIASDGKSWFLVSNYNEIKALYKFSFDFKMLKATPPGGYSGDWDPRAFAGDLHLGALNYYDDKIYVPLEPSACVWILDTDLNTLDVKPLEGTFKAEDRKQGDRMPWCAVNPWNKRLYSSKFGNSPYYDEEFTLVDYDPVSEVHCYDLQNLELKGSLKLQGDPVHRIQGGCFSENGHLYLASDYTQEIRAYSAFNGTYLGSKWVDYDKSDGLAGQEMEGVFAGSIEGDSTYFHVVVLDNDLLSLDDIYIKHYSVPSPGLV